MKTLFALLAAAMMILSAPLHAETTTPMGTPVGVPAGSAYYMPTSATADQVAPVSTGRWTGFYVGGHVGMDYTKTDLNLGPFGLDGLASDGLLAGVHVGFDLQLPGSPIVLGVGADYTWTNTEFAVTPGILSAGIDHSWSLFGRLGIVMGSAMPYVLAGYTEADASASILGTPIGGTTLKGWLIGGGIEVAVANNVSLAGEYRFTQFDGVNLAPGFSLDTDRHEIRAALKYKFNPF